MPYDRQLIVEMLDGSGDDVITRHSQWLDARAAADGLPSSIVTIRSASRMGATRQLATGMRQLSNQSRVYLQGHGDWQNQKLAAWDAKAASDLLGHAGMPSVQVVSILGCSLARDIGAAGFARLGNSADSFASKLHKLLKTDHNIATVVKARTADLSFFSSTSYNTDPTLDGTKGVMFGGTLRHHQMYSKVRYEWRGGSQLRFWDYEDERISPKFIGARGT